MTLSNVWPTSTTGTLLAYPKCRWCSYYHDGVCSLVKAIDYYPDGSIKRVEFFGQPAPSTTTHIMLNPEVEQCLQGR
jgi:hypothetical protein